MGGSRLFQAASITTPRHRQNNRSPRHILVLRLPGHRHRLQHLSHSRSPSRTIRNRSRSHRLRDCRPPRSRTRDPGHRQGLQDLARLSAHISQSLDYLILDTPPQYAKVVCRFRI